MKNFVVWQEELKKGKENLGYETNGPEYNWPTEEEWGCRYSLKLLEGALPKGMHC